MFIFFDFNPPIQTNTVRTTVSLNSCVSKVRPEVKLECFPNPAAHTVWIKSPSPILYGRPGLLRLTDATGKTILTQKIDFQSKPTTLPLPSLPGGTYHLEIIADDVNYVGQLEVLQQK